MKIECFAKKAYGFFAAVAVALAVGGCCRCGSEHDMPKVVPVDVAKFELASPHARAQPSGDAKVWGGKPVESLKKAVLPDCFTVDYVRVFDEV